MESQQIKQVIEAAIFAADTPLSRQALRDLFDPGLLDAAALAGYLQDIEADYAERGIELREVASGFRFQVKTSLGPWVSRLWQEKPPRYSRAMLETLALIAYRQPTTRGEIEDIRGVSVSSQIIKTLMERGWIRIVGQRDVPGRPSLYATTKAFLDYFDLKSLEELPTLAEIRDLDEINRELAFDASVDTEASIDVVSAPMTDADPMAGLDGNDEAFVQVDAVLDAFDSQFKKRTDDATCGESES